MVIETTRIMRRCPMCGEIHRMDVDAVALEKWERMELSIQKAFPEYSPVEREFIKTGYCASCQELLFGADVKTTRIM